MREMFSPTSNSRVVLSSAANVALQSTITPSIDVTQTPQGIAFSFDGAAAVPLPWIESWTFRRNNSLLTFRRSTNSGPATELRFDTGGDHLS